MCDDSRLRKDLRLRDDLAGTDGSRCCGETVLSVSFYEADHISAMIKTNGQPRCFFAQPTALGRAGGLFEKEHPMRRSRFTENEIVHLLYEASTGVSAAEICRTARISLRTLYRWRRRFGGLAEPAVLQMKELAAENARLRGLVSNLRDRLQDTQESRAPSKLLAA